MEIGYISLNLQGFSNLHVVLENGKLKRLEETSMVTKYLGAICDGFGEPMEFVEIWTQESESMNSLIEYQLTISQIERRWNKMLHMLSKHQHMTLWRGPWENEGVNALVIDGDGSKVMSFSRCSEKVLKKKGIDDDSSGAHRYLADNNEGTVFSLDEESSGMRSFWEEYQSMEVFNSGGGPVIVRSLCQIKLKDFSDLLEGSDDFRAHDCHKLSNIEGYKKLANQSLLDESGVGFFNSKSNVDTRVCEVFYLKLLLLKGAIERLQGALKEIGLPFGNLKEDDFEVKLDLVSTNIPFLYNHQVELKACTNYVSLPIGNGDVFPVLVTEPRESIFVPKNMTTPRKGTAKVTLKRIEKEGEMSIIKGVLHTDEPLGSSSSDLLRVVLRVGSGKKYVVLAQLDTERYGKDEWAFTSYPMSLPSHVELEPGGTVENTTFELLPKVGSTVDLYSIAVLAVRIMLCGQVSLEKAMGNVDEFLGPFGKGAHGNDWDTGAGKISDYVYSKDDGKWSEIFGSHVIANNLAKVDAQNALPDSLWWNVFEWILRLFPGSIPGAFAKNYEDYDHRAPEVVFEPVLESLDILVVQARLLLFGNPASNNELGKVIKAVMAKS